MNLLRTLLLATIAYATYGAKLAEAHKLYTRSSDEERRLSNIDTDYVVGIERLIAPWSVVAMSEPVHEEITNRMYGCDGDASICAGYVALAAPAPVLAGVRWNDDPPFGLQSELKRKFRCNSSQTVRFETQPVCWAVLFQAAKAGAENGKQYGFGDAMLYRTHFGDLQFMHAMASADGISAASTLNEVLGWAEFAWRASLGEYKLETRLKDIDNAVIRKAFGRGEWRLLELYTLGAGNGLRLHIDDVAFGSLLHTVQDSFSESHVEREVSSGNEDCSIAGINFTAPGAVVRFHSYVRQDHKLHAKADTRTAFMRHLQTEGDVVEVGRAIVKARSRGLKWNEVKPLFHCIFNLRDPKTHSGAGAFEG